MSWNDERVEQLKKLWAEGLSASQIADRIGSMTRNAIIGKIHRLGLQGRATTIRLNSRKPKKPKQTQTPTKTPNTTQNQTSFQIPTKPPTKTLPPPKQKFDTTKLIKFVDLEADQCKWPVGDPQHEHFGFCGAKRVEGTPYCEDCCRVAFRPPAVKNGARSVAGGRKVVSRSGDSQGLLNGVPGASERDLEGVS